MNRRLRSAIKPVLALAGLASALPNSAVGQVLEEIVVTAERRATALQDTPISIVAFTADTIENKGISDVADLAQNSPNLEIQGSRGYGNNQPTFAIRGISGGGGVLGERGVALYIDGIYVPRTNGSVFKVLDIDRVEVLRGPQGSLFGRNSTGGAIRLFTKQPGNEFAGNVKLTGGNQSHYDASSSLNLPVNDSLSLRMLGAYLHEGGYVRRGSQMLGDERNTIGRFQAAFTPSSTVKATFGLLYSDAKSNGTPQVLETFDMRPGITGFIEGNFGDWLNDAFVAAGGPPLAPYNDPRVVIDKFSMPSICLLDDFNPDWDAACEQHAESKYYQADSNVEWKINDQWTLTSITGYAKMDHAGVTDWQMIGTERRPDDVTSKTFYQEFQLNASLFNQRVDVVTGLNYFYEDSSNWTYVVNRRGTSIYPANPNGNGDAGLFITGNTELDQKSNSFGWFNSATWRATDKFNVTAGARYAYDKKSVDTTQYRSANFVPLSGNSTFATLEDNWSAIDWRGTLDYHFTKDLMLYVTASKAYRAGAMTPTTQTIPAASSPTGVSFTSYVVGSIPPERVKNYEAGLRTTWFDGRLRLNPTYYRMNWFNRQAARQQPCQVTDPDCGQTGFKIGLVNSGDVDLSGYEVDGQFSVTDRLIVDGAAAVTHFTVKDIRANSGPNVFPAQASPTYSAGISYKQPLSNTDVITVNLNYAYIGSQPTHPTAVGDSAYELPSYGLANARIRWTSDAKHLSATLFANNLFDKIYATYATRFGGGYWDSGNPAAPGAAPERSALNVVRGRPREYGITLQYNF